MEQQNNHDNSGSIFINDRKTTDKHPDYKGSIIIDGQKYWLSGWLRTRDKRDGSGKVSFVSLSAEKAERVDGGMARPVAGFPTFGGMPQAPAPAQRPTQPAPAPAPVAAQPAEEKDDLPF